ncbi:MAG TPA: aminotransferase class IV, partial [Gemmatimonadaceae bacterium]|nr:aminotransferase class IV [Gemmatimonadaceae bacterium]
LPRDEARVSVNDRGFLFGDGAYEVTRAVNGRLFEAERHRRRLARTLRGLQIEVPEATLDELDAVAGRLLRENGLTEGEATIYLQVTRGAAVPRTHHFPPAGTPPTIYLAASRFVPPDALRARGASAVTVPDIRWARCDLKTVNLLPNALAKQRAVAAGADEAIFVRDGVVLEGAHTNVFAVLDGELRTAPATNLILPGVTRDVVLELARTAGLPVREYPLLHDELLAVSELFVTSTTSDVLPVVRVDGRPVGDGAPGSVAQRLHEALVQRMSEQR